MHRGVVPKQCRSSQRVARQEPQDYALQRLSGIAHLTGHLGYALVLPSSLSPAFELDAGDPTALEVSRFQAWGECAEQSASRPLSRPSPSANPVGLWKGDL